MIKFGLHVFAFAATVGISLLSMIYGWGLTPENWGWICFGYLAIFIPAAATALAQAI